MNIKDYLHLYQHCRVKCCVLPHYNDFEINGELLGVVLDVAHVQCFDAIRNPWDGSEIVPMNYIKPILRPLSDMTEEESAIKQEMCSGIIDTYKAAKLTSYLLSRHFDVFGLIEAGLAIDKTSNTETTAIPSTGGAETSDLKEKTEGGGSENSESITIKAADWLNMQMDGLGISRDLFFEQRLNTAIAMAWEGKRLMQHNESYHPLDALDSRLDPWKRNDEAAPVDVKYQLYDGGKWTDITKERYDRCFDPYRRIIPTALDDAQSAQIQRLKTVMIAAAEEIDAHWAAHCDEQGYGPATLLRRLQQGIDAGYGYTAGAFRKQKEEIDRLRLALKQLAEQPYPEHVFRPIKPEQWKQIHDLLVEKLSISLDRVSAAIGRQLRAPVQRIATEALQLETCNLEPETNQKLKTKN